ncbi:MAG TPA: response regulator, partial [Bauldia sp.]|nr:response regulator [Bauldia sp.]
MDVIVADDDLTQRTYLGALLARAGHTPIPAADGTEALERLGQGDASLVICDIEMPGFDGIELARRVRARSYGRYVYLILITARDRSEDFAAGLNAGADDFMPKPVDPAVLMVRLAAAERVIAYDRELGARTARLADAIRQLESDLAAGAEAQRALLPAPDHRLNAMRARSVFIPSRFVSGDVFNYFSLDATRAGFYAADVSGHGVRAALLAVAVGHLLRRESFAAMTLGGDVPAPHSLIAELNRRFVDRDASEDEYLTMIAGVADEVRDELTICRAGHPPPLVFDRDGRTPHVRPRRPPPALLMPPRRRGARGGGRRPAGRALRRGGVRERDRAVRPGRPARGILRRHHRGDRRFGGALRRGASRRFPASAPRGAPAGADRGPHRLPRGLDGKHRHHRRHLDDHSGA